MPEIAEKAQNLFEIKGVLTKFMRMLFPLEFRIDSISNSGPMLPFHYPLLPGEMIYLPERLEPFGTHGDAYIYYFVTTAHLAARHDFGTFKLKLSDIGGFEDRGETGVEAIDSFVASFDDPGLAGALMRLAESARIDAELARRYRGLAPRIAGLNRSLLERLHPESLSTMLVRAALDLVWMGDGLDSPFVRMACEHFAPVRAHGADVMTSVQQVSTPFISKRFCAFSAISGIGCTSIVTGTDGWMQFEFAKSAAEKKRLSVVLFGTLIDDRTICASRFLAIIAESACE